MAKKIIVPKLVRIKKNDVHIKALYEIYLRLANINYLSSITHTELGI